MDNTGGRNDLQGRRLSLIDVSSEDDSLITRSSLRDCLDYPSSGNRELRNIELSGAMDSNILGDTGETVEQGDYVPHPSESVEPEVSTRKGKYNLRKSLAWDSAFFTNAGVLEPDELSSIIEGVEKSEKHKLPGIQEELHGSADSISALDSDSLTLESLEDDVFEDVRASIQKCGKETGVNNAGSNTELTETENQSVSSSKKVELASRSKSKPKAASIKPNVGLRGPGKTIKQASVCPQVSQSSGMRGEPTPSLAKRAKVQIKDRPNSTTLSKRASMGDKHVKMGKDHEKSTNGKGAPVSRIPATGGLRNNVPKPAVSSKSSSLGSSNPVKTQQTISSSVDSSSSASSNSVGKSSLNSTKRKTEPGTGQPSSNGSTYKTPSRTASRNKPQSGSPNLSTYLRSVSKLTPSTSPASSVSEWSSESSSSSSTVKQRSNSSRPSLDTTSCKGVSLNTNAPHVLDSQKQCNKQEPFRHGTQLTGLLVQGVKKASTGAGTLPHPSSMRPSGLRLPSPKIGFFDGVKSAGRTPPANILAPPSIPTGLPTARGGNGTSNIGKAKIVKHLPARTPTVTRSAKPDPQETPSNMKPISPTPVQESSFSAVRGSTTLSSPKSSPGDSPEVQKKLCPNTGREIHLKVGEIEAEGCDTDKCDPDVAIAEKNSRFDILKDKVDSETKGSTDVMDMKSTPIDGLKSCDSGSTLYIENQFPCPKAGEGAICVQHNFIDDLNLINSAIGREDIKFDDQVDGLSREVEAIDINKQNQGNLIGNSLSLSPLNVSSKDDCGALELSCQKELHDFSQQGGHVKSLSKHTPCLSPTTYKVMSSTRTPFSVKDSFCNMDGSIDVSTGLTTVGIDKTATLASLESGVKENSEIA